MQTYIHHIIDGVMAEITAAAGGCGSVSVSWSITSSDMCYDIESFEVILSAVDMNISVVNVPLNQSSYMFTGLSIDTLYNVSLVGISSVLNRVDLAFTTVRTTLASDSM